MLEEKPKISLTCILFNLTQTGLAICSNLPNMPTLKCLFHPYAVDIKHGLFGKKCCPRGTKCDFYLKVASCFYLNGDKGQRKKCFPYAFHDLKFSLIFVYFDFCFVLLLQIEYVVFGEIPSDLSGTLVFSNHSLGRLQKRIVQLHEENSQQQKLNKECRERRKQLTREKREMARTIQSEY